MDTAKLSLLLADDDLDDCGFFREALEELPVLATLTVVNNGVELLQLLSNSGGSLPDVLYLDLNMPLKNGFQCLSEIKRDDRLKDLSVIIFSTSYDKEVVNLLYDRGAHYYIRKPIKFSAFKEVILKSVTLIRNSANKRPAKDKFVLNII